MLWQCSSVSMNKWLDAEVLQAQTYQYDCCALLIRGQDSSKASQCWQAAGRDTFAVTGWHHLFLQRIFGAMCGDVHDDLDDD
jgi:hypothetical protein